MVSYYWNEPFQGGVVPNLEMPPIYKNRGGGKHFHVHISFQIVLLEMFASSK